MNVLLVSIDSLRRDVLTTYEGPIGFEYAVETPTLDRFAERATVFETHYAGSLPCMPARREWHAGIREFLWRPWGPMEPFDDHVAALARDEGFLTALVTDHFHYFQHGAHGYYEDYNAFEFVRGHEYDAWKSAPRAPDERLLEQTLDPETDPPDGTGYVNRSVYARNAAAREIEADEANSFAARTFCQAADWLRENDWDDWFCYVDSFDVHEPFHCPEPYASMYTDEDPRDPDLPVWPYYGPVDEGQSELTERELDFLRAQFAGKTTMADRWLDDLLGVLDERDLWDETLVIITSDHGFLLGEHGWVGKNHPPVYDILARTPLLISHPNVDRDRVDALTSAVDLYPTMLSAMGVDVPERTHGHDLGPLLSGDADTVRDRALYGYWGASVNVTDGEYTYLHPTTPGEPAVCHSPTQMNARGFPMPTRPKPNAEVGSLPYADTPVWTFESASHAQHEEPMLFRVDDLEQADDLAGEDERTETRMREELVAGMEALDAPEREFERLGLESG